MDTPSSTIPGIHCSLSWESNWPTHYIQPATGLRCSRHIGHRQKHRAFANIILIVLGLTQFIWQALCTAHSLPSQLLHQLLTPQPQKGQAGNKDLAQTSLPLALVAAIKSRYNACQQAAVAACSLKPAPQFTLVQVCILEVICLARTLVQGWEDHHFAVQIAYLAYQRMPLRTSLVHDTQTKSSPHCS